MLFLVCLFVACTCKTRQTMELLDHRGISPNEAFLTVSYETYSKPKSAPSPGELLALISDKHPLTELCDCGNRQAFQDATKQLNKLIDNKSLRTICRVLK